MFGIITFVYSQLIKSKHCTEMHQGNLFKEKKTLFFSHIMKSQGNTTFIVFQYKLYGLWIQFSDVVYSQTLSTGKL